MSELQCTSNEY